MDIIRVLVVDDSAYMRKVITDMLESDPRIRVIDTARDGLDALEKIKNFKPDVVTLDVEMPRMDGLTALKKIMAEQPTPVIMLSSLTQESSDTTIKALSLGAVDFVPKPSGAISLDIHKVKEDLLAKVKVAAKIKPGQLKRQLITPARPAPITMVPKVSANKIVAIGSSTGGPGALQQIIPKFPANLSAGVLVVQHMPPGFTNSLAARLNDISAIRVKEAKDGDVISAGHAYIAPGGYHMVVREGGIIKLNQDPPLHSVRPAVDITFESVVKVYGSRIIGVILTGMGFDGAKGMALIKKNGGKTIAQDETTSIVFGMPKVAIEMGAVDKVLPVEKIGEAIVSMLVDDK